MSDRPVQYFVGFKTTVGSPFGRRYQVSESVRRGELSHHETVCDVYPEVGHHNAECRAISITRALNRNLVFEDLVSCVRDYRDSLQVAFERAERNRDAKGKVDFSVKLADVDAVLARADHVGVR